MMKKRIDNPKVFISYSWGTQEHQNKVLAFATRLMNDGIDVVLDKWDLSEGNDMNTFMEESVNDSTITNVLMLLDEEYAEKANNRTGGVGIETQIISNKVYNAVNQNKFLPIVFERDANGNICKPTYLQGRLHFDLSQPDSYEENYTRLVKRIFGIEAYKKPELGKRPDWVDNQVTINLQTTFGYELLMNNKPDNVRRNLLIEYLREIKNDIKRIADEINKYPDNDYLALYEKTKSVRTRYLSLLSKSDYVADNEKHIASFFENTFNYLDINNTIGSNTCLIFIHELFLYTIGYFLKKSEYKKIGYIFGKTYINNHANNESEQTKSYNMFYSGSYQASLDNAMIKKDKKNYHSGTANNWIVSIDREFCTKELFVEADLLCYNYSIYGNAYLDTWKWFPITYVYDNEYNGCIELIAKKMRSKEQLNNYILLFNYLSIEDFRKKFANVEKTIENGSFKVARFPSSFEDAPVLGRFIKAEKLGTLR